MLKVLHKRLREINGYAVRGTARQGLQLARQKETKESASQIEKRFTGAKRGAATPPEAESKLRRAEGRGELRFAPPARRIAHRGRRTTELCLGE